MSLTTGRGPLGPDPAGRFHPPMPAAVVYVEPYDRRVRGLDRDGRTVVDSEAVVLVHRAGQPPVFAFPAGDVAGVPAEDEPAAPGHVRVAWAAVASWYEEEEPVPGYLRNPYHRVDCLRARRRLRVAVAGTVLVDTDDVVALYETSLRPRLYVRPDLVRTDLLRPSATTTHCAYKGTASYWDAVVDGTVVAEVAWSYDDPLPESRAIAGHLSFYADRADVSAELPAPR